MLSNNGEETRLTISSWFAGRTVVVTGVGGEGQVGEVVARAFADQGASLALVDRTAASVEARAASIAASGHQVRPYTCDLTDEAAVARLATEVRAAHGDAIHALVHLAGGFAMSGPVADSTSETWNRQIAINLTTAYFTTRAFLPALRAGKGALLYFASEAALPGKTGSNRSAYAAAKTAVVTLMESVAGEERSNGVRANAVAPSSIRTAANVAAMGDEIRYVEREEVAAVVTFLCSDAASAVSGVVVPLT